MLRGFLYFPPSPGLVPFDSELGEYVVEFAVFDVEVVFEVVEPVDGVCGCE
jgi:hypothetical protein